MPAMQRPAATAPAEPGVLDAAALGLAYADLLLLRTVRDTHRAWARRWFSLVPGRRHPLVGLPERMHAAVSAGVYAGIGATLALTRTGLGHAGRRGLGARLDDSSRGRWVRAVANGLTGDRLPAEHPALAIGMAVRAAGRDLPLEPTAVATRFPAATGRLVVMVHGLTEDEGVWLRRREHRPESRAQTYAQRLTGLGWSPVLVRYNTGLPVAENALGLAALLQRLTEAWPVPVERLALVGHSMGGLVAVAAATDREEPPAETSWRSRLTDVVTLGTPHLGARVARLATRGSRVLALAPEAAAFGRVLDQRSRGIADLERGLPHAEPVEGVRYHLVSASVGRPGNPAGWLVGDLLVDRASAQGRRRGRALYPDANVLHVPGTGHLGIANHSVVADALAGWLH
jgi:pimeloyl-ACP methyl ester carboxylesterase